ncbi:MAG: methyl-accepting chemotaxis protein, partial [Marinobacter sp.]|nr:methyl-accepting chemotaxis protein [Marinobacter sp.]
MDLGKRLGLRVKVALPFVITSLALIVIGLFAVSTVRNLVSDTDNIADVYLPSVSEILNGDRDLYQALVAQMAYVDASFNNEDGAAYLESFNENSKQARDRFNQAVERLEGTGVAEVARGFDSAFDRWLASARRTLELAANGEAVEARSLATGETSQLFDSLRDFYDQVGAHADQRAQIRASDSSEEGQASSLTILLITIIAIVISTLLFAVFLKMIISSITTLRTQLDNIAKGEGDLTQRVPVEIDDDLGKLARSFNLVLENLQSMIGSIQQLTR